MKSKILEILDTLENPYPDDIFPSVDMTELNFRKRRDAMFGSFGRRVYNNALDDVRNAILKMSC